MSWLKRTAALAALGVAAFVMPAFGDGEEVVAVAPLDAIDFEIFATNENVTLPKLVSTGVRDNGEMGNAANIESEDEYYEQLYGTHFWSEDLDNASKVVLTNDEVDLPALPPFGSQARPSYYTNAAQKAVLHVETGEGALYRSIKWIRKDFDTSKWVFDPYNDVCYEGDKMLPDEKYVTAVTTNAGGLYFDALVKFTVVPDGSAPSLRQSALTSGDDGDYPESKLLGRLLVFINAFDTVGTPSNPDDYEPGWTNLCVVGGCFDSENDWYESVFTNKTLAIDPDVWHRLTIRVMSICGEDVPLPVFEIFIDATNETAELNKPLVFSHPCISPADLDGEGAYGAINESIKNQIKACEFITGVGLDEMPTTEAGEATLAGVGFRGEGYVDDYVVTTEKPTGIEDFGARYFFTLYWTPQSCLSSTLGGEDDLAYYVGGVKHDCDTDASQTTFEVSAGKTVGFTARARNFGYYAVVPDEITLTSEMLATNNSATIEMGLSNFTVHVSAPEGVVLTATKDGVAQEGNVAGEGLGVVVPTGYSGTVTNSWTFSSENVSASPFIRTTGAVPEGFTAVTTTNETDLSVSTVYRIATVKPTVNVSATFVENAGEVLPAFTGLSGITVWQWLSDTGVELSDIEDNNVSETAQQASYMFGTDMLGEMPAFTLDVIDEHADEGYVTFTVSAHTNATGTVSFYYESDAAVANNELRGYLAIQYKSLNTLGDDYKTAPWVTPVLQPDGSVKITSREDAVVKAGYYRAILTLFEQKSSSGN